MPSDGTTAFISYSRQDSEFVLRMARDLKAAGANVWLDQLDIQPGQRWARALQDAIASAPRFLVILSPASVGSTNVEDEVAFALEERKTIIPVLYCDCKVPFQLRPFQYADFRNDYDHGMSVLLHTMGVDAPAGPIRTVLAPVDVVPHEAQSMDPGAEKLAYPEQQAALEERQRQETEQARREEEKRLAAERARLEEERLAAERAEAEQKRREAAEKARLESEAKRAAEAAEAAEQKRREAQRQVSPGTDRIAEAAAVRGLQEQKEVPGFMTPARMGIIGIAGVLVIGIVAWFAFWKSPPPAPKPDQHSFKRIDPVANGGRTAEPVDSNLAVKSSEVGKPILPTVISAPAIKQALIGDHRLSLQSISLDQFGTATVTDNNDVLALNGSQRVGDDYLTVDGTIISVMPRVFTMRGVVVMKSKSINNGQPCTRRGEMKFVMAPNRKYWRLQQMQNPCEAVTDYVDIYLR